MTTDAAAPPSTAYRVLARKHRPATFAALIGQEALVRTMTNAFASGRLAHAYMLSGVRGIGKTTTARIIARALNCVGADGGGGPTSEPCGVCPHCRAIAEDRHVDVLEMDAASRTGVDDIRELIDGVRYRPTSARFKVYIIDEVHMLSRNAFNALLKTLEEPPAHVRFVFATTEVRKVPVTVLSRCQRFDLRRVDAATLADHLARVCAAEGVNAAVPALQLIARAADGSVRDSLSLLDQAIAHTGGAIVEEAVRAILGLADRTVVFDLLDAAMRGEAASALDLLAGQYAAGADPAVVLEDLLGLVHWLTRIKVAADTAETPGVPEAERVRGRAMAAGLGMAELTRAWQLLLKGLGETRTAPAPLAAAEMVLVRLAYAARLPTPAEALQALQAGPAAAPMPARPAPAGGPGRPPSAPYPLVDPPSGDGGAAPARRLDEPPASPQATCAVPATFREVVEFAAESGNAGLYGHLVSSVHLVAFAPGRIELRLSDGAPADLPRQLARFLDDHTGRRWAISVSQAAGALPLLDQEAAAAAARLAAAAEHPFVQAVIAAFPGAVLAEVRDIVADAPATADPDADEG